MGEWLRSRLKNGWGFAPTAFTGKPQYALCGSYANDSVYNASVRLCGREPGVASAGAADKFSASGNPNGRHADAAKPKSNGRRDAGGGDEQNGAVSDRDVADVSNDDAKRNACGAIEVWRDHWLGGFARHCFDSADCSGG